MSIGTAKPDKIAQNRAKHFFINNRSVADPDYTAGMFEADALKTLKEIYVSNNCCVAVGGSGLYIDALCFGIDDIPKSDEIRQKLQDEIALSGLESLQERLRNIDQAFYDQTDIKNPRRVLRGLEVYELTGKKYSELRKNRKKSRSFNTLWIGLAPSRNQLFDRINERVLTMIENGLEQEVRSLITHRNSKALQTLGYREMFEFIDGKIDLPEAIRLIQRNSRIYAKKQLTWFKRNTDVHWFDTNIGNSEGLSMIDKFVRT